MVTTLLKIKYRITWSLISASAATAVGVVFIYLTLLSVAIGLWAGAFALGLAVSSGVVDPVHLGTLAIAEGALVTVMGMVLAYLFGGNAQTINPQTLAYYLPYSRRLSQALWTITLLSFDFVLLWMLLAAPSLAFFVAGQVPAGLVHLVAALLGAALLDLVLITMQNHQANRMDATAKNRQNLRTLFGSFGVLIGFYVVLAILANSGQDIETALSSPQARGFFQALGWSPLGLPWQVSAQVAAGSWGGALAALALSVACLGAAWWLWDRTVRRSLVNPGSAPSSQTSAAVKSRPLPAYEFYRRLGLDGPAAAMAARLGRYWISDPRYLAQLLIPVVFTALSVIMVYLFDGDNPNLYTFPVMVALFAGQGFAMLVSLDSSALWMQMLAGISGRQDRAGRFVGMFLIYTPLLVGGSILALVVGGMPLHMVVAMEGLIFGLYLLSAGAGMLGSAYFAVPAQPPDANPMRGYTPPGGNGVYMAYGMAAYIILLAVCSPSIILLIVAGVTGQPLWGYLGGAIGVIEGIIGLAWAWRHSARHLERNLNNLYATISSWPGHTRPA